jgi:hypothetical protein
MSVIVRHPYRRICSDVTMVTDGASELFCSKREAA